MARLARVPRRTGYVDSTVLVFSVEKPAKPSRTMHFFARIHCAVPMAFPPSDDESVR